MQSQVLRAESGERRFTLVFDIGDEVMNGLRRFAADHDVEGAHLTAIGAFRDVDLAYWDWDTREYVTTHFEQQVEVASLQGNISMAPAGDRRKVHAHVVVGLPDHSAKAGHLVKAHVRPTLEVVLTETPTRLQREHDEETGLALLRPR